MSAQAYWHLAPGHGELRTEALPSSPVQEGEAMVRALRSGISRGTERLVHQGRVPAEVAAQMRAPFQQGEFPGPVKYGYNSVGVVEQGPDALLGHRVFCLHPHQDRYVVPAAALSLVPDAVPSDRAVLVGTMETALNVLWDADVQWGDRVAVVGMGLIGSAVAALLSRMPVSRLEVVDVDPARQGVADPLGVALVAPDEAATDCDVVVHASASEDGLGTALRLAGADGLVVEASWFGDGATAVPLGGVFHARRLTLRASQVGQVSTTRRARRSLADRRALATQALHDERLDALLGGPSPFADLAATMAQVCADASGPPCHVVAYADPDSEVL